MQALENKKTTYNMILECVVLISFVTAYFPAGENLFTAWSQSDDNSHGFLIIPIVFFILWQKRADLAKLPKKSSNSGLILLTGSLMIYLLAFYAEIKTIEFLSIIPSLAGIILYLYGYAVLREISFSLFFLLFMIPVPDQIYTSLTLPLQVLVSKISVNISDALGLPIFREGNIIHLPEGTLEVVEACSGMRSLVSLLAISTITSYFTLRSTLPRIILICCGIPAAIIVNVLRLVTIILVLYYFDFDLSQGTVHTVFGAVIFILAIALIFTIKGVLSLWDNPVKLN